MKTNEEKKAQKRAYYLANKDRILKNAKQYYVDNKEKAIEYQKEYQKEYREKNKDKIKEYRDLYKKRATNQQVVHSLELKLEELRSKEIQIKELEYILHAIEVTKGLFASELDKDLLQHYINEVIHSAEELKDNG